MIIGDMPFGSYVSLFTVLHIQEESISQCIHNCVRVVKEGGVDGIKLEGGVRREKEVKALTQCGIAGAGPHRPDAAVRGQAGRLQGAGQVLCVYNNGLMGS